MSKKLFVFIYACCGLLLGCNQEKRDDAVAALGQGRLSKSNVLKMDDGFCAAGLSSLETLSFEYWDGRQLVEDFFSEEWDSRNRLSSDLVSGFFYGFQESYYIKDSCSSFSNLSSLLSTACIDRIQLESTAKPLKICDAKEYPESSLEAATLSAAGAMDQMQGFLKKSAPLFEANPVSILMLPDILIHKGGRFPSQSVSDNAAWVLSNRIPGISSHIALYPSSEEYLSSGRPSFWKVPWVVSHEFGHHLFYQMMPHQTRLAFAYQADIRKGLDFHQNWLMPEATARSVDQVMMASLNEAFSDLLAHYAVGGDSSQIVSLSCQFRQRDPSYAKFNDDAVKSFSRDFDSFTLDTCKIVNPNDMHTLGSVISYFWDQFIGLYGVESVEEKGFYLLKVTSRFLNSYDAQDSSRSAIEEFILALSKVLRESFGPVNSDQCELVNEVFSDVFTEVSMEKALIDECNL